MATQLSPGTETVVDERTRPVTDDGDHERFSHYVPKEKLTEDEKCGKDHNRILGDSGDGVTGPCRDLALFEQDDVLQ